MHNQAYLYVERQAAALTLPAGARVLEIGAYNVNGTIRHLFPQKHYHGIDAREGPGVDEAVRAQDFDGKGTYDVVVSAETLEHDSDPEGLIAAANKALKPGGVLILTAAGPERAPHSYDGSPELPDGEHYKNVTPTALKGWLAGWEDVVIERDEAAGDIYATARKPAEAEPKRTTKHTADEG